MPGIPGPPGAHYVVIHVRVIEQVGAIRGKREAVVESEREGVMRWGREAEESEDQTSDASMVFHGDWRI